MKPQTWLISPDKHHTVAGSKEGGSDPAAMSVFHQLIGLVKPDVHVDIGDIGEWAVASPWRWKKKRRPDFEYLRPLMDAEITAINKQMDETERRLDKVKCNRRIQVQGNHELWQDAFADETDRPEYTSQRVLRIAERGHEWYPYGEYLRAGKLAITHGGHFTGQNHAHTTLVGTGVSTMYAHFHDVQIAHLQRLDGQIASWAIGCLCKLDKAFLRGKPSRWSHAVAVVRVERDKNFHVELIDIFQGIAYWGGKRIEAH